MTNRARWRRPFRPDGTLAPSARTARRCCTSSGRWSCGPGSPTRSSVPAARVAGYCWRPRMPPVGPGLSAGRLTLGRRALELLSGDPVAEGTACLRLADWAWWDDKAEAVEGLIEQAIRLIPTEPPTPERALAVAWDAMLLTENRRHGAEERQAAALSLARACGSPTRRGSCADHHRHGSVHPRRPERPRPTPASARVGADRRTHPRCRTGIRRTGVQPHPARPVPGGARAGAGRAGASAPRPVCSGSTALGSN